MNFYNFSDPNFWLGLLYSIPAILLALSVHECAHAYAAYKCGDPTARNLGRMTLSPIKHLDLVGTICLLFFGFGWAKPVPINSRNFKHGKRDNVIVSLSGIIANFIVAFVATGILILALALGFVNVIFIGIMTPIITINVALGIFNLLPIPPLDGFQLISTFLSRKAHKAISFLYRYGFLILIILIITGVTSTVLGTLSNFIIGGYFSFYGLFVPVESLGLTF